MSTFSTAHFTTAVENYSSPKGSMKTWVAPLFGFRSFLPDFPFLKATSFPKNRIVKLQAEFGASFWPMLNPSMILPHSTQPLSLPLTDRKLAECKEKHLSEGWWKEKPLWVSIDFPFWLCGCVRMTLWNLLFLVPVWKFVYLWKTNSWAFM